MSSNSKKGQPSVDPYDALGIAFGASEAEITKAYRKLALKLHPDKQRQGLSPKEQEEVAKQFHDIKEARSFLLDAEHAEDRRQFDARRESDRIRRETEAVRDRQMSDRRKRMREELKEKELQAQQEAEGSTRARKQQKKDKQEKEVVDQLRREGLKRREEQANRNAEKELERELRKERKERRDFLEERQVRLKWDRKKIKISPSEHSIATLLSEFGAVETVEFLGKKGNQALVTFEHVSSCRPCVDAYATSKAMRAKFVGQRKDHEEEEEEEDSREQENEPLTTRVSHSRDAETLEERRLRQAAEREALLREMQQDGGVEPVERNQTSAEEFPSKAKSSSRKTADLGRTIPFPIPFPDSDKLRDLSPAKKLEMLEDDILGDLVTPMQLQSLKRAVV